MVLRCCVQRVPLYTLSRSGIALGVRVLRGPATSLLHRSDVSDYTDYVVAFRNVVHARHVQYNLHPAPVTVLLRDPGRDITRHHAASRGITRHHATDGALVMNATAAVHFPRMDTSRYPGLHPLNDGGFNLDVVDEDYILALPFQNTPTGVILPSNIISDDGATTIAMHCHVIDPLTQKQVGWHFSGMDRYR